MGGFRHDGDPDFRCLFLAQLADVSTIAAAALKLKGARRATALYRVADEQCSAGADPWSSSDQFSRGLMWIGGGSATGFGLLAARVVALRCQTPDHQKASRAKSA